MSSATTSPRTATPQSATGVLPTASSWCYFAVNGTDHRTHDEQNAAIDSYIRWRNARAQPKTGFAIDSPIRTWTHYPIKVA